MSVKRTLGFSIALVAIFAAGFFFPRRDDLARSYRNPYPLIDPTRSIVSQEHFFSTIEPLRKQLKEIVARYEKDGNRVGLYFEFLNTGSNVSINQESRFWPASLTKMPTAMAVMKKVEKGDWKLSNELVLFAEDKDDRFGDLYKKPVGTRFTIEELVKSILIDSDNTAHRILVRNLSSDDYTDIFEAIGLENLFDKEYNITAKEYSRIPRALYAASYINREHSEMILLWLAQSSFEHFLGQGVPDEVVFPHKIGEEGAEHIYLDSGIVYVPDRPYLVTVMIESKGIKGKEVAGQMMKEVSEASYVYVSQN